MSTATPTMQPPTPQPFATWNSTRGVWETTQLDLSGQPAPLCRPGGYVDRPLRALSCDALLVEGGQHNRGLAQRSVRNAMSVSEAWYLAGGRFPIVGSRSRVRRLSSRSAWR